LTACLGGLKLASTALKERKMDTPTTYFHWGFILISVPNLLVIAGMVVLFAIALVLPFPHAGEGDDVRNK
jgi:hypothetical protein